MDTFLTIASESEGLYKDKGSKFLSFAYPVSSEDEVKEKIDFLRKKYFDARHHCYAYRLGANGERYRANDDGEPANSAGKPILGQLTAHGVTNVLVVVVRYFGGILLGVGGLVQAYKQAAADALSNAKIVTEMVTEKYRLTFDYTNMNRVLKVVKEMKLECSKQDFNSSLFPLHSSFSNGDTFDVANCTVNVQVRKSQADQMKKRLEAVAIVTILS